MMAAIFLAALWINKECKSSLLICLAVMFNYYFPTELVTNYWLWWITVISLELLVLYTVNKLNTTLTLPLICIYYVMLLAHTNGVAFKFYANGNYSATIKFLELLSAVACVLFSKPILTKIKEIVECRMLKR